MLNVYFTGKNARVFKILQEISYLSDAKFKMAAAIIKGNIIIGIGHNQMNRGMKIIRDNYLWPVEHCELAAIRNSLKRKGVKVNGDFHFGEALTVLRCANIYIFRQWKNGHPAMARPCDRCRKNLLEPLGFKKVIYTISDPPYFREEAI